MLRTSIVLPAALLLAACGSVNVGAGSGAQCMGYDADGCIPICFADATCLPPLPTPPYVATGPLDMTGLYVGEMLLYDGTVPVYYAGPVDSPVPGPEDTTDTVGDPITWTPSIYNGTWTLPDAWPMVLVTWPDGSTNECSTAYLLPAE